MSTLRIVFVLVAVVAGCDSGDSPTDAEWAAEFCETVDTLIFRMQQGEPQETPAAVAEAVTRLEMQAPSAGSEDFHWRYTSAWRELRDVLDDIGERILQPDADVNQLNDELQAARHQVDVEIALAYPNLTDAARQAVERIADCGRTAGGNPIARSTSSEMVQAPESAVAAAKPFRGR